MIFPWFVFNRRVSSPRPPPPGKCIPSKSSPKILRPFDKDYKCIKCQCSCHVTDLVTNSDGEWLHLRCCKCNHETDMETADAHK